MAFQNNICLMANTRVIMLAFVSIKLYICANQLSKLNINLLPKSPCRRGALEIWGRSTGRHLGPCCLTSPSLGIFGVARRPRG